jgi:hypothetical protein
MWKESDDVVWRKLREIFEAFTSLTSDNEA